MGELLLSSSKCKLKFIHNHFHGKITNQKYYFATSDFYFTPDLGTDQSSGLAQRRVMPAAERQQILQFWIYLVNITLPCSNDGSSVLFVKFKDDSESNQ